MECPSLDFFLNRLDPRVTNTFPVVWNKGVTMKIVLAAMLCLASSVAAHAQFGGLGKKDSGGTVTAVQVAIKYTAASQLTLAAYVPLLKASGLKEQAAEAEAQAENLRRGTVTSEDRERTARIFTESSRALQERLADKSLDLGKEAKEDFVKGSGLLAGAAVAYTAAALDAKGYKPGGIPDAEARLAIAIVKQLPGDMSTLKAAIGAVIDYSKAKGMSTGELDKAVAGFSI
jgi:hypothetical protein